MKLTSNDDRHCSESRKPKIAYRSAPVGTWEPTVRTEWANVLMGDVRLEMGVSGRESEQMVCGLVYREDAENR